MNVTHLADRGVMVCVEHSRQRPANRWPLVGGPNHHDRRHFWPNQLPGVPSWCGGRRSARRPGDGKRAGTSVFCGGELTLRGCMDARCVQLRPFGHHWTPWELCGHRSVRWSLRLRRQHQLDATGVCGGDYPQDDNMNGCSCDDIELEGCNQPHFLQLQPCGQRDVRVAGFPMGFAIAEAPSRTPTTTGFATSMRSTVATINSPATTTSGSHRKRWHLRILFLR